MMLLTVLIALPIIGSVLLWIFPEQKQKAVRTIAILFTTAAFVLSSALFFLYEPSRLFDFTVRFDWIKLLNTSFYLGADGLSLVMIFLTSLLFLMAVIGSFTVARERERLYFTMLLVLESALFGVFSARDFILFFVFWEAVLIPMYFLIGNWGSEDREYASMKFFIYTFVGSVFMLAGALFLYSAGGAESFDFDSLSKVANGLTVPIKALVFWLMFIGFVVKVPSVPFHTWLPDAYVQAPTAASAILAGVLAKMGAYGLFRFNLAMFPDLISHYKWYLFVFAAVSIIYGCLLAFAQSDIKRLVAYSSIAHMGFVMAGIASTTEMGYAGAIFAMWAHGLITGLLFFLVGMSFERYKSQEMDKVKALAANVPELGWAFVFAAIASLGMPGLAGFVGEFLSIAGSFETFGFYSGFVAIGVLLNATYLLKLLRNSVFGASTYKRKKFQTLSGSERVVFWVITFFIVITGMFPESVMFWLRPTLESVIKI